MKKAFNLVYVLLFLSMLIIPLCRTNTKKQVTSDIDNRRLVEYPEVGQKDYSTKVEAYLRDRIGFRDQIVTGYQKINDIVARELSHPLYTYGQEGYMFFNMHYNIRYSTYHDLFVSSVVKMKNYCEERGIPFYFMFEPEKIAVYRQFLPAGVNYNDDWVVEMLNKLREQGVTVVDNHEMLTRISAREQVFNRQYDAGHWNDLGAFYATNNLWKAVEQDFPGVTEYSPDDFTIKTIEAENLPASRFSVNEEVPSYKINTEYVDVTKRYASLKHDSRYPFFQYYVNTTEDAARYPKMLVFHGSYYNRCPEFFIGRASEYIGVHDYQNVLDLDYYYTLFQPEMVVFEVAEYTLDDKYFDTKKMTAIDYNPGIDKIDDAGNLAPVNERDDVQGRDAYIIYNKDFDEIYYEGELPYARYAYLAVNGRVYDLHLSADGIYSAEVSSGIIQSGEAIIVSIDYDGERSYNRVRLESVVYIDKDEGTCSAGAKYDKTADTVVFETDMQDNLFNSANIQLLDGITGAFLETIDTAKGQEVRSSTFIHKRKSGWYRIRLKANGNKMDEWFDSLFFLEKGRRYCFEYNVLLQSRDKIVIGDYELFGACPLPDETQEMMDYIQHTPGVSLHDGIWTYSTSVSDNRFGAAVLNLIDEETNNQVGPLVIATEPGRYEGKYIHIAKTGKYLIKLRGDTNLSDEYILVETELIQGTMYEWKFDLHSITADEVEVSNVSFREKAKGR